MPRPATMTLRQVARELQISERTAIRRVQDGTIPAFKLGSFWRIPVAYLDQFRRRAPEAPVTLGVPSHAAGTRHAEKAPAPARLPYKM